MKINKIKMIENPKEDIILSEESLDALLGGTICTIFKDGMCRGGYDETKACSSPGDYQGMKCGEYKLV